MTELLQGFLSRSAAWGVLLTLAAFALGTLLNKATGKAIFNPLLLGSIFVIIRHKFIGTLCQLPKSVNVILRLISNIYKTVLFVQIVRTIELLKISIVKQEDRVVCCCYELMYDILFFLFTIRTILIGFERNTIKFT